VQQIKPENNEKMDISRHYKKGMSHYDMLLKEQIINSEIDKLIEHPNKEYHLKQKIYSQITSGKTLKGNSYMIPKSRGY